jgi:antitoxin PrlF
VPIAALTSKGQVTIPKKVRELLDLHTGDKIEFVFEKEGAVTVRAVKKTVDDLFGKLYNPARKPLSVEEINEAIQRQVNSETGEQADESA